MDSTLACHVFFLLNTDTEPVFFFPRKVTTLAKLMFITLVLFQFGSFILSVEAFNQFTPKAFILVQQYLM